MNNSRLDELLEYGDAPEPDGFTEQVMARVRRKARQRRLILWGAGVVGAGFGVLGASWLAAPLGESLDALQKLPISLGVGGAVLLVGWLLHDELSLNG